MSRNQKKIRRTLMIAGSTKKYLLYAVGEILLVMIGILLALQVNNWKTDREKLKLEKSTLVEIQMALTQDTGHIVVVLQKLKKSRVILENLLDQVESKQTFDSTMAESFMRAYTAYTPTFRKFNTAAFDLLKERGMDIIKNHDLRRKITEHYTINHQEIEGWFTNLKNVWAQESERLYDHFKIEVVNNNSIRMIPNDYSELLEKDELMNPFYHFSALLYNGINYLNLFLDQSKDVLSAIDSELEIKG